MGTLWNDKDRAAILARLDHLEPDMHPIWGRMSCPEMVAHLVEALRMALGELDVRGKRTLFRYPPFKHLMLYVVPFPKGVPTAPELLRQTPVDDWTAEVGEAKELIERFAKASGRREWPDHPIFGSMTKGAWGVLAQRHIDHHLRQFGV